MNKDKKSSSLKGCISGLIIGSVLITGALGYASLNGINLNVPLSFLKSMFMGDKGEIEQSAKDTKSAIAGESKETSSEVTSSIQAESEKQSEETIAHYEPMPFSGEMQVKIGQLDQYQRAISGHIQLKYSDKPTNNRELQSSNEPVGLKKFRFKYENENGKIQTATLMEKGNLLPYSFLGEVSEKNNIFPVTRYLKVGTLSDKVTDAENPYSLLFYEKALNEWLKEHKDYTLDYYAVANYQDDELVPRSISLFWMGYDAKGKEIKVELKDAGKAVYSGNTCSVTLLNVSKNAKINYKTGEATPLIK